MLSYNKEGFAETAKSRAQNKGIFQTWNLKAEIL